MQQQQGSADRPSTINHLLRVPRRVEHGDPHATSLEYVVECGAAAARLP
jgi:hypothetical protein